MNFKDIPSEWKRATRIAIDIEKDLEHKDWLKLFDPTRGKYRIGNTKYKDKLADVLQLPTTQVQMTVGEMWEDYLVWKEPQLQPTTFKAAFLGRYTNALNGREWDVKTKTFNRVNENLGELPLSATIGDRILRVKLCSEGKTKLGRALNEAFIRAQSQRSSLQSARAS